MSLSSKLWSAILILMSAAFLGSFLVSTYSAQRYFSEQLYVKNMDNVTSLAMSISLMEKDPVTIELLLSAQFDTGHYEFIRLVDPEGRIIAERSQGPDNIPVPGWFQSLVPLAANAGAAQIQDRWKQYGRLELKSHAGFAYEELWQSTVSLLLWFALAAILTGVIGTKMLRVILQPLDSVIDQAKAIGERRYITTPEPSTREFRQLVRIMNTLSGRVRNMLTQESRRVESLRREAQLDAISGIYNRKCILDMLGSRLGNLESENSSGLFVILRIENIAEMNTSMGWKTTDQFIRDVGKRLLDLTQHHAHWATGRLSGADFAVITPPVGDPDAVVQEILKEVQIDMDPELLEKDACSLIAAGALFNAGESVSTVLSRADCAITATEQAGKSQVEQPETTHIHPTGLNEWRSILKSGMTLQNTELGQFPVVSSLGELIHFESPARLRIQEEWLQAGQFISWASRLNLLSQLDMLVLEHAVQRIASDNTPLSINLSHHALTDINLQNQMLALIEKAKINPGNLWLDISEFNAFKLQAEFRSFCMTFKPIGCKIGLKHAGTSFSQIGEFHDVGLNHLKVDPSFIHSIETAQGNQLFLRSLCMVAHAIDLKVIAEGVTSEEEIRHLYDLGFDGLTGRGIQYDNK